MSVLNVNNLKVSIGETEILRGISFTLDAGQTLGLVGESGCGKTMLGLTMMGMLPPGGRITEGSVMLDGKDLAAMKPRDWLDVRGAEIAMVMQDPFTSLNPVMRVGDQIAESYVLHRGLSWSDARTEAIQMMGKVGIPEPELSAKKFPHQMSGGQRQRVVIATAYACRPKVLIADEPTTALDVTLQAQILTLLEDLQREAGTAIIVISHNIGVIAAMADRMGVFYAGQIVESGPTSTVLTQPSHPYTMGLLEALPSERSARLSTIPGQPPSFVGLGSGCAFRDRCSFAFEKCGESPCLEPIATDHQVRCWLRTLATTSTNAPHE